MSLTNKEIRRALKKMRIRSGDVVLVRRDSDLGTSESLNQMRYIMEQTSLQDVLIVAVDDLDDIKSIPEHEMFKHGWLKRDKVRSLVLKKVHQENEEDGIEN